MHMTYKSEADIRSEERTKTLDEVTEILGRHAHQAPNYAIQHALEAAQDEIRLLAEVAA